MSENDQAAVEVLCMLTYTSDQEGERHDCVECADAASAILDAIRAGKVPIPGMVTEAVWRAAEAECNRLRAEAARLTKERDTVDMAGKWQSAQDYAKLHARLKQAVALLRECYSSVHHVMTRQTQEDKAPYRDLLGRIDALLAGQPAPVRTEMDYGSWLVLRDLVRDAALTDAARAALLKHLDGVEPK